LSSNFKVLQTLYFKFLDAFIFDYLIPEPKWSHIDYFVGREAGFYSNNKIIDILRLTDDLTLNDV
jgi:hypothetical protein